MLLTAGLDIILRVSDMADSGLVARRLGSAELVVCASPAYLRVMVTPKQPQDLAKHEAIIYARPGEEPSTNWRFTRGDTRLVVSVPIRLVMRDGVGGIDAAIKGCGIVRSFEITTREAVAAGQLSRLLSALVNRESERICRISGESRCSSESGSVRGVRASNTVLA